MKMKLIFATNNQNKVAEIKAALTQGLEIITLKEAGIDIDIPEPHNTLEENATEKSTVIHNLTKQNCFSEDTGLEVAALNGEPGVRSARYAGEDTNNKNNIALLLQNMQNKIERSAQFKTVISLVLDNVEHQFTGICTGKIIREEIGEMGFGYDAIFVPDGDEKTFAQMNMEEKNKYSHRKKVLAKLIDFLNNYNGKS
jgi:XTP/dITP diphosphohydrolase